LIAIVLSFQFFAAALKTVRGKRIGTDGMFTGGPHGRLEAALQTALIFYGDA
jgi:hypothetical protein